MINVVGALVVKRKNNSYLIMTQLRIVSDESYDPLYKNTWEVMTEKIEEGENVIEALIRGCREEFGTPDFMPKKIFGDKSEIWTTGKEDKFIYFEPFCLVQSLGPPQPWLAQFFIVEVHKDFEPNYGLSDGEATSCQWRKPVDLEKEIKESPEGFMGLDIAPLYKLCLAIIKGEDF